MFQIIFPVCSKMSPNQEQKRHNSCLWPVCRVTSTCITVTIRSSISPLEHILCTVLEPRSVHTWCAQSQSWGHQSTEKNIMQMIWKSLSTELSKLNEIKTKLSLMNKNQTLNLFSLCLNWIWDIVYFFSCSSEWIWTVKWIKRIQIPCLHRYWPCSQHGGCPSPDWRC